MNPEPPALQLSPARNVWAAIAVMIALSLAALSFRLWIGWQMGFLPDVQCWQIWGLDCGEFVTKPEYPSWLPLPNNYPPLYSSVIRIMRWVHRGLGLLGEYPLPIEIYFHDNPDHWRPLLLYLKLPPILADVVTAWLIFFIARRLGRLWLGVGVAALYSFSPGIIYDGAYFGQTDTILIMFIVAALWAFLSRRPVWLGAMLMAAPLMKAQAVFALPVFGLVILAHWAIWRPQLGRLIFGGLLTLAVVVALAAWTGELKQFHDGYFGVVGQYPLVTVRAYNFWWLITRNWDRAPQQWDFPHDDTLLLGLVSYRVIGAVLFFAMLGLILWRLHKARYTPFALTLALAAAGWAFFNLPTQMHERYSIPALGLMSLLPLWHRKWWLPAIIASITVTLNIAHVCPFIFPPCRLAAQIVDVLIFSEQHLAWAVLAFIHILMLPLVLDALWREGRPAQQQPSPASGFPMAESGSAD
jgi:Gpi18-like mannosyltransferase